MKKLTLALFVFATLLGPREAGALGACLDLGTRLNSFHPGKLKKPAKFSAKRSAGPKSLQATSWFAGTWTFSGYRGDLPSGGSIEQFVFLSMWPSHGGDYPFEWESVSIQCSGANCDTVREKNFQARTYTCHRPGSATLTAFGTYRDENDDLVTTTPSSFTFNCTNQEPTANFRVERNPLSVGSFAKIDSTANDPDGYENFRLYHEYSLQRPAGSSATLTSTDLPGTGFYPDVPGEYVVSLKVNDCVNESEAVQETITVEPEGVCPATALEARKRASALAKGRYRSSSAQTCVNEGTMTEDNSPANTDCEKQTACGKPVNLSTGAMWHRNTDFVVPARTEQTALRMDRVYTANSAALPGDFGPNWQHGYETKLTQTGGGPQGPDLLWIDPKGGPWLFKRNATGWTAPPGSRLKVTERADSFELLTPENLTYKFSKTTGRLLKITERHGDSVDLTYDSANLLSSVSSAMAGAFTIARTNGRITSITRVRDNLTYTYTYNADGRLASATDFANRKYTYTYVSDMPGTYAQGMLATLTDPIGRKIEFSYDANGRSIRQKETGGALWEFQYRSGASRETVVRAADGSRSIFRFNSNLRTTSVSRLGGGTTLTEWKDSGFIGSSTDELGFVTTYGQDSEGNLSSVKRPADTSATFLEYDPVFRVPTFITPVTGAATRHTLNAQGDVVRTSRNVGGAELALVYTRDQFGNIVSVNNGRDTHSHVRDENGLLTTVFDARNPETRTYDSRYRVATRAFQSGRVLSYTYDDDDRVLTVTDSAGPEVANEYDPMGRLVKRTVSGDGKSQVTRWTWDAFDRMTSQTDALGRTTTYSYEKNRVLKDPTVIRDPAGRETRFEYDELGRKTKIIDPRGSETELEYNLRGELVAVRDAVGNVTRYAYDGNGRKSLEERPSLIGTTPVQQKTNYTYDGNDSVLKIEHKSAAASGGTDRIRLFEYDEIGRMKKKTLKAGDLVQDEATFTYEPQLDAELFTSANNGVAQLQFGYEARPPYALTSYGVAATAPGNPLGLIEGAFTVGRDATNEISEISRDGSVIYTKTYDPAGRLVGVDAGALKTALQYDGFGRKVGLSHSTGETQVVRYDELNRVTDLKWKEGFKDSVQQHLTYDLAGNVSHMAREHSTYDLSYDPADQLVKSVFKGLQGVPGYNREFGYDGVGNRVSDSENGAGSFLSNFLTQNGVSSFTASQDSFGEVAQEVTGDKVKNYTYRADGKISSFESGNLSVNYFYDGLERLLAKAVNQNGNQYTQSYTHLGDENRVLLGKAGDGSVTTYVDGQGPFEHLGEVKGSGGKGYITDHLGSVLNSPVAGSWKTYGLWGEPSANVSISPTSNPVKYGFTGHMVDLESGLNRTKYRQYDPKTGRWLSQDPIGLDAQDVNYYRYVFNSPLKFTDPDGRLCIYSQSTGSLICIDAGSGTAYLGAAQGYAGQQAGLNNPLEQNTTNYGPVPQGSYTIGIGRRGSTGPNSIPLFPQPGTDRYYNRNSWSFLIHGDSSSRPSRTASMGCPIFPGNIRSKILPGETLWVTP